MCGILGSLSNSKEKGFKDALTLMRHRGPDGNKKILLKINNKKILELGHTRLAIIDLSNKSSQPCKTCDKKNVLIFNGEIYNYKKASSDTLFLFRLICTYRLKEALKKINGMFAFAVYKKKAKKLFLVRDPFGIKPLYIKQEKNTIFFASEIKPLLLLGNQKPSFNNEVLNRFLVEGVYDNNKETIFKGIRRLMPGHLMEISLASDKIKTSRWWRPKIKKRKCSVDILIKECKEIVLESVRSHLRSDVPLTISLSGGIDSSILAYSARFLCSRKIKDAFGYLPYDKIISEEKYIKRVCSDCNYLFHPVLFPKQIPQKELEEFIKCQEEPVGNPSSMAEFYVYRAVHKAGFKVALAGHGADEMFGGYEGYPEQNIKRWLEAKEWGKLYQYWKKWPSFPRRSRLKLLFAFFKATLPAPTHCAIRTLKKLQTYSFKNQEKIRQKISMRNFKCPSLKEKRWEELTTGRVMRQLRYCDKSSMHFSVEVRTPFLIPAIADFSFSIDDDLLNPPTGETKWILRKAFSGIVPDEILWRKDKVGFEVIQSTQKEKLGETNSLFDFRKRFIKSLFDFI